MMQTCNATLVQHLIFCTANVDFSRLVGYGGHSEELYPAYRDRRRTASMLASCLQHSAFSVYTHIWQRRVHGCADNILSSPHVT